MDLGDASAIALLRRLDVTLANPHARLPTLSVSRLPLAATADLSLVLLPGGALAVRGPDETLVCDPQSCVVFSHDQLAPLRAQLTAAAAQTSALAVPHPPRGPGTITLLADARHLVALQPDCVGWTGPALLRCYADGAVAWSLTPAPDCLVLAASVLGVPLAGLDPASVPEGRLVATSAGAPPDEAWQAATAELRFRIVSLGLAEHVDALLAAELSDSLRHAVIDACCDGEASLAARLTEALGVLPACLPPACLPDPVGPDGMALPPPWSAALASCDRPGLALLGVSPAAPPSRTIPALRSLPELSDARLFRPGGAAVPLLSDAALFLARRRDDDPTLGLWLPLPTHPLALYRLADRIARRLATPVLAVAPGWGFCHQADPTGLQDTGNAAWFGLGIDLDELDEATLY